MLAGALLLAVVWVFLLRYVPAEIDLRLPSPGGTERVATARGSSLPAPPRGQFIPNRSDLVRAFVPRAAATLVVLLVLGLAGGWLLAGTMLTPLTRITDATRRATQG